MMVRSPMYWKKRMLRREKRRAPKYSRSQLSFALVSPDDRFLRAVSITKLPNPTAKIPRTMPECGGVNIFTSTPNEECHQLSKGNEASIRNNPHTAIKAPSGPRNPQIRTEVSRALESLLKVV